MKKVLFTLLALVLSVGSYAQLIANKTDNKVTMNFDFFSDFQLQTNENWDARGFNQGFSMALTYNFPLGESSKHTVGIGVGMSSHNYYSYSRIANPYATDTLQFIQYRDESNFKRFKVNPTYVDIPLELRFRIKDAWKIGVGFKFGIRVAGKTKYVGPDENGVIIREKYCGIDNLERYAYAATLRVGYKWISAYCSYQMSRVFELGHEAPAICPLSVGFTIAPF